MRHLLSRLFHKLLGIRRVLIVGPSGAGKTFITHHLRVVHHEHAVDADTLKGLCRWVDEDGNKIRFEPTAGKAWLKTHHFVWNREYLRNFLAKQKIVFLFGLSKNVFDMVDLFDELYYLDVSASLEEQHLQSADRSNPWGKHKGQRDLVVHSLASLRKHALTAGAHIIRVDNAGLTPDDIFAEMR